MALDLIVEVAANGRISSVRAALIGRYPAFTRCATERLTALTLDTENVAGWSRIMVTIRAAR
jgi:hypothetical protein